MQPQHFGAKIVDKNKFIHLTASCTRNTLNQWLDVSLVASGCFRWFTLTNCQWLFWMVDRNLYIPSLTASACFRWFGEINTRWDDWGSDLGHDDLSTRGKNTVFCFGNWQLHSSCGLTKYHVQSLSLNHWFCVYYKKNSSLNWSELCLTKYSPLHWP